MKRIRHDSPFLTSPALMTAACAGVVMAGLAACAPPPVERQAPSAEMLAEGSRVYEESCAVCHLDGSGSDAALPLRDAAILADEAALIAVIHSGREGRRTTAQGEIASVMPGFSYLTDAELAAVATWLRAEFGGARLGAVSEEEARRLRAALKQ